MGRLDIILPFGPADLGVGVEGAIVQDGRALHALDLHAHLGHVRRVGHSDAHHARGHSCYDLLGQTLAVVRPRLSKYSSSDLKVNRLTYRLEEAES